MNEMFLTIRQLRLCKCGSRASFGREDNRESKRPGYLGN